MKSKVFNKFLISYAIMLLIPLVIGSIAYVKAGNIVAEESNLANLAILRQSKQVLDVWFSEVQQLAEQITINKKINEYLYVKDAYTNTNVYTAVEIFDDFVKYKRFGKLIRDFYIFFNNSDAVFTSTGKYDARLFYQKLYTYGDQSFEEWRDKSLKIYYYGQYTGIPTYDISANTHSKKMLTYMKSLSVSNSSYPDATIAVLLDGEGIRNLLGNMADNGRAYIIDKNNRIIMSSDDQLAFLPSYTDLNSDEGIILDNKNEKDLSIIYTSSSINGWKYVAVVPREVLTKKVNYIKNMTLGVVAA